MKAFIALLLICSGAASANPAALQAVNTFRAGEGRGPLVYDQILERAARLHAQDMLMGGFFDHTGSDGSSVGQRVTRAGYRWCYAAENIAKGQRGLSEVLNAWAGSPGHRRNMLARRAEAFGLYEGANRTWVMVLAAPC